ncbi:hypothetical protein KZZ52_23345 [Dactylosporangium sp. AC04546]|uniref:hypothetical protein n=1 Tax=Dactylosporangium sp. AC04546 TaxID=2862460 RepID=UPI001EE05E05|nr:hypothetical protein [Dactylosporangium sp. AC04546]WVK88213.1 hypothetical protein KZZ52_23345 [Dactylosporangium sp. AC04546]
MSRHRGLHRHRPAHRRRRSPALAGPATGPPKRAVSTKQGAAILVPAAVVLTIVLAWLFVISIRYSSTPGGNTAAGATETESSSLGGTAMRPGAYAIGQLPQLVGMNCQSALVRLERLGYDNVVAVSLDPEIRYIDRATVWTVAHQEHPAGSKVRLDEPIVMGCTWNGRDNKTPWPPKNV